MDYCDLSPMMLWPHKASKEGWLSSSFCSLRFRNRLKLAFSSGSLSLTNCNISIVSMLLKSLYFVFFLFATTGMYHVWLLYCSQIGAASLSCRTLLTREFQLPCRQIEVSLLLHSCQKMEKMSARAFSFILLPFWYNIKLSTITLKENQRDEKKKITSM